MATISHIPNPVSISVKVAGYTIPANRYARVVANVSGASTFTIAGVTALASTSATWSVLAADALKISTTGVNVGGLGISTSNGGDAWAATGSAFSEATAQMVTALSEVYFMPAGTVINGTGTWRATVEEYGG